MDLMKKLSVPNFEGHKAPHLQSIFSQPSANTVQPQPLVEP